MRNAIHWFQRHSRRLIGFSGAQFILQLINALTGFIILRAMEKHEYAWFTIANSLTVTLGTLADSGLGSAMVSLGGAEVGNPARFSSLIRTTRRMRFVFLAVAAMVVMPTGWWLLRRIEAPAALSAALLVLTLVSALVSADITVLNAVNRLHTRLRFMIHADYTHGVSRLLLIIAGKWAGLTATLATVATTISHWLQSRMLHKQTDRIIRWPAPDNTDWRAAVMPIVWHSLPLCLFTCVQGQLNVWLLGVFGNNRGVADIGALSRLGFLFTFMAIPMAQLASPALGRCREPRRLKKLCIAIAAGYAAAGAAVAALGSAFPAPILWILGAKYGGLHVEITWYLAYLALGLWSTVLWSIVLSRSWLKHAWLHIPLTIATQAAAVAFMDLGRIVNVIVFSCISAIPGIAISLWLIMRGLREYSDKETGRASA